MNETNFLTAVRSRYFPSYTMYVSRGKDGFLPSWSLRASHEQAADLAVETVLGNENDGVPQPLPHHLMHVWLSVTSTPVFMGQANTFCHHTSSESWRGGSVEYTNSGRPGQVVMETADLEMRHTFSWLIRNCPGYRLHHPRTKAT